MLPNTRTGSALQDAESDTNHESPFQPLPSHSRSLRKIQKTIKKIRKKKYIPTNLDKPSLVQHLVRIRVKRENVSGTKSRGTDQSTCSTKVDIVYLSLEHGFGGNTASTACYI